MDGVTLLGHKRGIMGGIRGAGSVAGNAGFRESRSPRERENQGNPDS